MSKYLVLSVLALAAILTFGWLGSKTIQSKQSDAQAVRPIAPNFKLANLNGDTVALSSYQGKLVYLGFWASWCGDCVKQVVPQRHLEQELSGQDKIVFLHVSVDSDRLAWAKAVRRNKLQAIELLSIGGFEGNINELYGVDEIPHYVLIDKEGKIIEAHAPFPSDLDASYFKDHL